MVWTGDCAARPFSAFYRYLLDRSTALSHLTPGTMAPPSTADRDGLCVSPVEEIWRSPLEPVLDLHPGDWLPVARLPPTRAALSLPVNAAVHRQRGGGQTNLSPTSPSPSTIADVEFKVSTSGTE